MTVENYLDRRLKLIRLSEVSERVGLSRASIYRRIKEGKFPDPVRAGSTSRWVTGEIDDWIDSIMSERQG